MLQWKSQNFVNFQINFPTKTWSLVQFVQCAFNHLSSIKYKNNLKLTFHFYYNLKFLIPRYSNLYVSCWLQAIWIASKLDLLSGIAINFFNQELNRKSLFCLIQLNINYFVIFCIELLILRIWNKFFLNFTNEWASGPNNLELGETSPASKQCIYIVNSCWV